MPTRAEPSIEGLSQTVAALYAAGRYAEALEVGNRMMSIAEGTVGADSPAFAGMLTDIGVINQALGKFAEAERLHLRALAIAERALGKEHVDLGTSLHNLAVIYTDTGRYAEAESTYQRALAIADKEAGLDHATTLFGLASVYRLQERYRNAEDLMKQVIVVAERTSPPGLSLLASALSSLGELYMIEGRTSEADPILTRAVTIGEVALGQDNPQLP
jgi:tetratricopeptide (TPR) repeat protein